MPSWNELRTTLRTLARARGFTIAATLTLALGIGLVVATLAIINAYLVRELPYPAAARLHRITYSRPGEEQPEGLAALRWESLADVIEHPIAWDLDMFYLTGGAHTETAPGAWVTPGFMQGLGIRVALGRAFEHADFEPGAPQVALISDDLWRTRFGGERSVIGQRMQAHVSDRPDDPETFTIVGVMPADFWHLNRYTQVFTPLRAQTYPYYARLREGVAVAAAEQRITMLVRGSGAPVAAEWAVTMEPVREGYVAGVKPLLLVVASAVGLVLLMACANVAVLVLLRGMRRQKEIAVRLALGASRAQVARILVLETIAIALLGTVVGSIAAWLTLGALAPTIEQQLGARVPGGPSGLAIDLPVIATVVALALAIGTLLALAPIIATSRRTLFTTLRNSRTASTGGAGARWTRHGLIGVEIAGSLALLVGCGLMVKTVLRMLDVDLGARYAGIVAAPLALRSHTYPDAAQRVALYDRVTAAIAAAPAASATALSSPSPLSSNTPQPVRTDDRAAAPVPAALRAVTPEYFALLGMQVQQGRSFAITDRGLAEGVAIVSRTAAERLWPGANPIGRRILVAGPRSGGDTTVVPRTVVGVVGDTRQSPTDAELADVYLPLAQAANRFAVVVAKPTQPLAAWTEELRRAVGSVDRDVAVNVPQALEEVVEAQLARPRFLAALFAAFGLFASMLGAIGLYAVISYAVKQREQEIAIRMAVGAHAGAIVRLLMRDGVLVLIVGVAAGLMAALALGRLLQSQLFGVAATDAPTLAIAALSLAAAAVLAIWVPARRATRTDPVIALKEE